MRQVGLRLALVAGGMLLFTPLSLLSQNTTPKAAPPAVEPRRDAHVIMISIDGLVPDYYTSPRSRYRHSDLSDDLAWASSRDTTTPASTG